MKAAFGRVKLRGAAMLLMQPGLFGRMLSQLESGMMAWNGLDDRSSLAGPPSMTE
jgi:hypothetical protein